MLLRAVLAQGQVPQGFGSPRAALERAKLYDPTAHRRHALRSGLARAAKGLALEGVFGECGNEADTNGGEAQDQADAIRIRNGELQRTRAQRQDCDGDPGTSTGAGHRQRARQDGDQNEW